MINFYYFSKNKLDKNTWIDFSSKFKYLRNDDIEYTKISGYGWAETFAFNLDGTAIYISCDGDVIYKGIWFYLEDVRIAIFERGQ